MSDDSKLFRIKFQFQSGREVYKIGTQADIDRVFDKGPLNHATIFTFEYPESGPLFYINDRIEYIDATPL